MVNELSLILIGSVSALSGVLISEIFGYLKRKSEEKRWYVQHFLGLKIDALKNLHNSLEDCYKTFNIYGNTGVQNWTQYQTEILTIEEKYRTAIRMAIIYLSNEEKEIFESFLGQVRQIGSAIRSDIPAPQVGSRRNRLSQSVSITLPMVNNWPTFIDSYNAAVDCVRELLNPRQLKEYIENI